MTARILSLCQRGAVTPDAVLRCSQDEQRGLTGGFGGGLLETSLVPDLLVIDRCKGNTPTRIDDG